MKYLTDNFLPSENKRKKQKMKKKKLSKKKVNTKLLRELLQEVKYRKNNNNTQGFIDKHIDKHGSRPSRCDLGLFQDKRKFKKRIQKQKKAKSGWPQLTALGFNTYADYLKSKHWKKIKRKYRTSNFTQHCLICKNKMFILHHLHYDNIGAELLTDFIPLCKKHHKELHKYLKLKGMYISQTYEALRQLHNWTKKETVNRFSSFKQRKRLKRKRGGIRQNPKYRIHTEEQALSMIRTYCKERDKEKMIKK